MRTRSVITAAAGFVAGAVVGAVCVDAMWEHEESHGRTTERAERSYYLQDPEYLRYTAGEVKD